MEFRSPLWRYHGALRCGRFLAYQEVHNVQHGIEVADILIILYSVLAVDHEAWCTGNTEELHITLAFP